MNKVLKFLLITVIMSCSVAMAEEVLLNPPGKVVSLSSEVRQALDSAYLAAKDAKMLNPANLKDQNSNTALENNKVIKSSRDPVMQMIAVGLGVGAAMMVMNYFSGGTSTSGSFSGFSSAMLGGMLGDYAYRKYYAPPLPSVPSSVAQRITP